ncbi:ribose-phosphate pyrophosphokinase [Candidatus Dependentiae bacterium]|nr:ribose-phosphate pyrophosphokinase [Candidatus Dependentiae bacterium]
MNMQHEKVVVQFNAPELGLDLAQELNATLLAVDVIRFADTECDVFLEQPFHSVVGKSVILVAQFGGKFAAWSINDFLLSLCFLAQRLHAAGVFSLTCVLPYYPYARQDIEAGHGGISSASAYADLLQAAGVDDLIVFDLHNPLLVERSSLSIINNVTSKDFWVDVLTVFMQEFGRNEYVLVAPDSGATMRVQAVAQELGISTCFVSKRRTDINQAAAISLSGSVAGKYALLLDDIIDTGRTAVSAADLVLSSGAIGISGFFTHGVLSSTSLAVMSLAPFDRILVTDSLHKTALSYEAMQYVSMHSFIINEIVTRNTACAQLDIQRQGLYEPNV